MTGEIKGAAFAAAADEIAKALERANDNGNPFDSYDELKQQNAYDAGWDAAIVAITKLNR
jgi:hypothetical protein